MRYSACVALMACFTIACSVNVGSDDGTGSALGRKKHDMAMPLEQDASVAPGNDAAVPQGNGDPAIASAFYTPSTPGSAGQQPVIDAITGAQTSIHMMMFHLTQMPVVNALVAAAGRGVDVQIIADNGNWTSHTSADVSTALANAGITVTPSSTGFSITHTKAFLIDGTETVIMTLNLTSPYPTTRDYAVVTYDPGVAAEFESVFQADLVNAANNTTNTPPLSDSALLWSPTNSTSKLVKFIEGAQTTLVATSENLGDTAVQNALIAAAGRGVTVRLISPLCDQNVNPLYDIPSLATLTNGGVEARAMPAPPSATQPYMHAKMMIADGTKAYIGSMNYSTDSLTKAREVGILFSDAGTIAAFSAVFEQDWAVAVVPPAESDISCPAATSND
jgi:phosphatidylserine/phosphatidylglycerophosphate/cardiolipin synthase-like enzyme